DESLIKNTFNSLTFGFGDNSYHLGLTQSKFSYVYRDIETAFSFLSSRVNQTRKTQYFSALNKLSCIRRPEENVCRDRDDILIESELVRYLRHVYYFHLQGNCKNYAASSDIARLVILYIEGGIYLDVDVELNTPQIRNFFQEKNNRFDAIKLHHDLGFGNCTGRGWESGKPMGGFGNAIIVSQPQSESILKFLLHMARNIKTFHLGMQIYESPKNKQIGHVAKHLGADPLDIALQYKENKQIFLDTKCGILASVWRLGIYQHQASERTTDLQRRQRRMDYTIEMTGPRFYSKHFGFKVKISTPLSEKYKIRIDGNDTRMFSAVNADGNWAGLPDSKNKKR
ncbi:MAG: hypothetical protein LBI71_07835, partial [Enterobacteriaceae bacterium]|nr:hypothetical protein [Enterobacteriaceae bacterium]